MDRRLLLLTDNGEILVTVSSLVGFIESYKGTEELQEGLFRVVHNFQMYLQGLPIDSDSTFKPIEDNDNPEKRA